MQKNYNNRIKILKFRGQIEIRYLLLIWKNCSEMRKNTFTLHKFRYTGTHLPNLVALRVAVTSENDTQTLNFIIVFWYIPPQVLWVCIRLSAGCINLHKLPKKVTRFLHEMFYFQKILEKLYNTDIKLFFVNQKQYIIYECIFFLL